jgi:hypothetical protein
MRAVRTMFPCILVILTEAEVSCHSPFLNS